MADRIQLAELQNAIEKAPLRVLKQNISAHTPILVGFVAPEVLL